MHFFTVVLDGGGGGMALVRTYVRTRTAGRNGMRSTFSLACREPISAPLTLSAHPSFLHLGSEREREPILLFHFETSRAVKRDTPLLRIVIVISRIIRSRVKRRPWHIQKNHRHALLSIQIVLSKFESIPATSRPLTPHSAYSTHGSLSPFCKY